MGPGGPQQDRDQRQRSQSGLYSQYQRDTCQRFHRKYQIREYTRQLAEAGHGLALLPNDQARPGLDRLFEFPAAKPSELWLLTHPDLQEVERIRLVMRHLAEAFQAMSF